MKIGITYDTIEDYPDADSAKYSDFASLTSISFLKRQFEIAGYETVLIGSAKALKAHLQSNTLDVDLVYNTAEGIDSRNREGAVPAILELYGIPYIGSDAYALSLSLNKYHTKILAEYCHVPTPEYRIIYPYDTINEIKGKIADLTLPFIVKPNYEGSSMGLYLVSDIEEAVEAILKDRLDYHQEILCEKYIAGMELTVPIIGTETEATALDVVRFCKKDGSDLSIFDTEDKHYSDIYCEQAQLPDALKKTIIEQALTLHRMLGCRDINRLDFRIDMQGNAFFLEMNPLPALDPEGSFVCAARSNGMNFPQLLQRIVQEAEKGMQN